MLKLVLMLAEGPVVCRAKTIIPSNEGSSGPMLRRFCSVTVSSSVP